MDNQAPPPGRKRRAGVIAPLFSIPSRASWGIGEIGDLPLFARWLASAGLDVVQLLPINEMEGGQSSPYSALSAMAIDPIFISVEAIPDFASAGGTGALAPEARAQIEEARQARRVNYALVRDAKQRGLALAFDTFSSRELATGSERAAELQSFVERERWWLDDYSLFRALHEEHDGRYWREWEPGLRNRQPDAIDGAKQRLAGRIRYYQYLQWIAAGQWDRARSACGGVALFGDFPFMVNGHSADVWARQDEFDVDASVGVPPGPGSPEGQDWGLPAYRWDVMRGRGYSWLAERARRCGELVDAFRVDHLVGFYRTFTHHQDGRTSFSPPDEPSQIAQGEAIMSVFRGGGAGILAEDLGVVPDAVRESQERLAVPGMKVLRWERHWHREGQPFRDPREYAACSVAISGTHDTETMAEWWDRAPIEERTAVVSIPGIAEANIPPTEAFSDRVRDALLTALFRSGSDVVLVVLPDVFGWRDRINTPSLVSGDNWTWRLPWPVDALITEPAAGERAAFLRALSVRTGREALS
jgi:4-alpha-glucanotransferase